MAAITAATTGVLNDGLPRLWSQRIVAAVNSLAKATGMRRFGRNREHQRRKASQEREER
jgi:hypothetical protein